MISVQGLTKRYKQVTAVSDLSFDVDDGELFALLGTNGAGKTTTISCMTTLLGFDEGKITIDDLIVRKDDHQIRERIGVVFQQSLLDPLLTVDENLALRAGLYGVSQARIDELAELVDLNDFRDRPYGVLSGGQKRRVDIARALLNRPQSLFLDEPTAGLDPQSREQVWDVVAQLREELGLTVLLTTHYMQETEGADEVIIIDHGEVIAAGTPMELRAKYSQPLLSVQPKDGRRDEVIDALEARFPDDEWYDEGGAVHIHVSAQREVIGTVQALEPVMESFQFVQGSMDDVFLNLVHKRGDQ